MCGRGNVSAFVFIDDQPAARWIADRQSHYRHVPRGVGLEQRTGVDRAHAVRLVHGGEQAVNRCGRRVAATVAIAGGDAFLPAMPPPRQCVRTGNVDRHFNVDDPNVVIIAGANSSSSSRAP